MRFSANGDSHLETERNLPSYLIHIGPHKTGTTYLQRSFDKLRPALAARGVCYPDYWGGSDGHHSLVEQLWRSDDRRAKAEFDRLNRAGFETILLSSETFSYLSDDDVRRLHALFGGEPATVVFYCRRWSELIPSSWREMVKHGSLLTMPEFALSCLSDPVASKVVNFDLVLARFATVFGAENLRIASYNGVLKANEDLLTHFCRCFLDWPDVPPTGFGQVNVSLDLVDSEIIRVLNALEWTRSREARQRLYHRFMNARQDLPVRWLVERSMQYVVDRVSIDDAAPALAQLHAGIVERYRQALVPPAPDGALFEPHASDVLYIRPDYLMVPGVVETLRGMQATLLGAG
jgi:hypothetical protein